MLLFRVRSRCEKLFWVKKQELLMTNGLRKHQL
jgi:hypothetical protein